MRAPRRDAAPEGEADERDETETRGGAGGFPGHGRFDPGLVEKFPARCTAGVEPRRRMRRILATLVLACGVVSATPAWACGGSGPGGTGMCTLDLGGKGDAPELPAPRVSTSVGLTDTTILFGDGRRAAMKRAAIFGTFALPVGPRLAFESSVGGFAAGELRTPARKVSLGPGVVTALGLSVRAVDGQGSRPLVVVGATLSATYAQGDRPDRNTEAYDLRATVMVGKTLWRAFTPYALGRVFGGPIWFHWDDGSLVRGTDLYKYQLGAGLSLSFAPVDVFAEVTPLGERTLAAGLGFRL